MSSFQSHVQSKINVLRWNFLFRKRVKLFLFPLLLAKAIDELKLSWWIAMCWNWVKSEFVFLRLLFTLSEHREWVILKTWVTRQAQAAHTQQKENEPKRLIFYDNRFFVGATFWLALFQIINYAFKNLFRIHKKQSQ